MAEAVCSNRDVPCATEQLIGDASTLPQMFTSYGIAPPPDTQGCTGGGYGEGTLECRCLSLLLVRIMCARFVAFCSWVMCLNILLMALRANVAPPSS